MRTFLAIETTDAVKRLILSELKAFHALDAGGAVRWVLPENIHLTMAFLGDTSPERLPDLDRLLGDVACQTAAFPIRIGGIGVFPNVQQPRVIWLGVTEQAGALADLHRRLWEALQELGWEPEERPFRAHLTLGRVRREAARPDLDQLGAALKAPRPAHATMTADSLTSFRSDLSPRGPVYTRLGIGKFREVDR